MSPYKNFINGKKHFNIKEEIINSSFEMKLSKIFGHFKMDYKVINNSDKIKLVSERFYSKNKNKFFFVYNNKMFR